ncbi:Hypothetical protein I5071_38460 [Sandaracinus amylolyticus]|nr:Hypothetical protein I5071_38460 [Sandaracinus amylolyticus]
MSKGRIGLAMIALAGALSVGCGDDDGSTGGTDAGQADAGCTPMTPPTLPTEDPPTDVECTAPDGGTPGMGACCYVDSQSDVQEAPELRLRYLEISAPEGSALTGPVLLGVLNNALEKGTFAWLIRVEGADADGEVTVRTGFGVKAEDGTYAFPTGDGSDPLGVDDVERYGPAEIPGTITGERVVTERHTGSVVVPVLNEAETDVQLELELRNIQVIEGELNSERSCVGWQSSRGRFQTGAILDGFIEVESARQGMVVSGPVMTTVCAAIAGLLTQANYCEENPQSMWITQPDSLCTETGCTANASCEEDVCDRGGDSTTGLPACNAWRLVAQFAAQGVEITN